MIRNYFFRFVVIISLLITSCSDDDYTDIEDILPVATNDIGTYELLSTVTIDVSSNDTTGDTVLASSVSIVGGTDTDGNTTLDRLTVTNEGIWTVNPVTGAVTFTPNDGLTTSPTPISYTIKDAEGNVSNAATITISAVPSAVVDLTQVPYPKLSDYKFFAGIMKNQIPSLNVLPLEPESTLFTDYAHKKRFVWMPPGTKATYNGDGKVLELPVGAVLIKNFYYDNVQPSNETRIIETRIMIKKSTGWIFAEYVWNTEQTEAFYNMDGSYASITWTQENGSPRTVANYRIPSETECFVCHKANNSAQPIGIKPQNLNNDYPFSTGVQNQLAKWSEVGYLDNSNLPSNIPSAVDYKDSSKPLVDRVRSYLDINCAHCHSEAGHCGYRPMRFAFSDTAGEAGLTNMGVCVDTEDMQGFPSNLSKIINAGNPNRSMLFYRINTNNQTFRMPLHGRSEIHTEGVELIRTWIESLQPCQ
ncbi:hypothetical protein [Flavobacterium dankookense]|uniref:Putative repeat protein (TIGR03806 family) n=1 Tax=Flavobacterium dankookense TaxID=706186 RepID=A0A4R6QBC3_9FLAO|nr:hypothetical protein [Flavobacterium dankookense]TDP59437.1 putative repeat protein (TIGR03806 family) [Flavobacterium dankookense]